MLTATQHVALTFIVGYIDARGIAPSCEEIAAALGLASKSGVSRLLRGIEERGYIRRLPHRARAIEVIRRPDAEDLSRPFRPDVESALQVYVDQNRTSRETVISEAVAAYLGIA